MRGMTPDRLRRMMHGVSDDSDEQYGHGSETGGAGMSSPEEARLRALTLGRGGSKYTSNRPLFVASSFSDTEVGCWWQC